MDEVSSSRGMCLGEGMNLRPSVRVCFCGCVSVMLERFIKLELGSPSATGSLKGGWRRSSGPAWRWLCQLSNGHGSSRVSCVGRW